MTLSPTPGAPAAYSASGDEPPGPHDTQQFAGDVGKLVEELGLGGDVPEVPLGRAVGVGGGERRRDGSRRHGLAAHDGPFDRLAVDRNIDRFPDSLVGERVLALYVG